MSNLLEPGTYPPDLEEATNQRRVLARRRMLALYGMALAGVGATAFAHFAAQDPHGTLWAIGWTLVCLGLSVWGTWSYFKRARYGYEVVNGAVHVEFDNTDYYVPPHRMEPFLKGIMVMFDEHFVERFGEPAEDVIDVNLVIRKDRPKDPYERVEADRVIGITYHQFNTSYVYGPYALHDGGLGYEFRLQLCEYLIGGDELSKIDWMKGHDLL